ncbi:efflux RND transporter permease subunit [Teredinibacter sp. KSP-S5-2]|uniref:efflux RND transporter permease subunit n=1 Tax=Teredinibacter sp. KSP-S5-2 TaxID=3034506 RepID=UPI0029352244|nr:MMPL family transporter [Teredinibacter sp. KSP-S5-2]WNO11456.1 MMPL family transporter [Teredinibacter sp. KSP-S5-2]
MYMKIAGLITYRPKTVLLAVLILTLLFASGMQKLGMRTDFESELPSDDVIVNADNYVKEVFGDKDLVMIVLGAKEGTIYEPKTLSAVYELSDKIRLLEGIVEDEVRSLSTVNNIKGEEWGVDINPFMSKALTSEEEINSLRKDVKANKLAYGSIVSKNEKYTLITATLYGDYDQAVFYKSLREMVEPYRDNNTIYLAGDPVAEQEISGGIQKDLGTFLPLAFLLVIVGLILSFRTVRGVILPFTTIILSIVWTMGLMGHLGFPISMVSSMLPILMVAVASSYAIHVVHRYYIKLAELQDRSAAFHSLYEIMPAVLMTGITSSLGAVTLMVFDIVSIREFGLISSIAIASTTILSLTYIPSWLAILKPKVRKLEVRKNRLTSLLEVVTYLSIKNRVAVLSVAVFLMAISALGITKINVGNDFIENFPKGHVLRGSFQVLNDNFGGARYIDVMIEGPETESVKSPEFLTSLNNFQSYSESVKDVGRASSVAEIVTRINYVINAEDERFDTIPETRELASQYLLLYAMSGNPGDFSNMVDYDYQRTKTQLFLTTSDQQEHKRIYTALQENLDSTLPAGYNAKLSGEVMYWSSIVDYIVDGKIKNIFLALGIVFVFCLIIYRSFILGFVCIIPLLFCTALVFGAMGFLDIRLDASTAIITAISVGIGVDFAIHYISKLKSELMAGKDIMVAASNTAEVAGTAIIYDVISNILSFSAFLASGFLTIQYFGWLIGLSMVTICLATISFMPAIMSFVFTPASETAPQESAVVSGNVVNEA